MTPNRKQPQRKHRGFPCPICGEASDVITSRMYVSKTAPKSSFRHRLRICAEGHRFKTREVIDDGYKARSTRKRS